VDGIRGTNCFLPFEADTDYFGRDNQQWMINFRVSDMTAMIQQLTAAGIEVVTRPEWDSEIGRFARIHDPEGNPIELWEPAAA
jgi:glyoxylase I family protein